MTYDSSSDGTSSYNCAVARQGPWWYGSYCGYGYDGANLNGRYLGRYGFSNTGMMWYEFGYDDSLKASSMMIRPAKAPDMTREEVEYTGSMSIQDCSELLSYGSYPSGIYTINPNESLSIDAYCDMDTDGGGWIVFQKRFNGSVDFHQNWDKYTDGFGSLGGEFFWGLTNLHLLTNIPDTSWELMILLKDTDDDTAIANYHYFNIGDATSNYRLAYERDFFCGNAGESLYWSRNDPFSTFDKDNDGRSSENCADTLGAWWYNGCSRFANLNGEYETGMRWFFWKRSWSHHLKATTMMVRPMK